MQSRSISLWSSSQGRDLVQTLSAKLNAHVTSCNMYQDVTVFKVSEQCCEVFAILHTATAGLVGLKPSRIRSGLFGIRECAECAGCCRTCPTQVQQASIPLKSGVGGVWSLFKSERGFSGTTHSFLLLVAMPGAPSSFLLLHMRSM